MVGIGFFVDVDLLTITATSVWLWKYKQRTCSAKPQSMRRSLFFFEGRIANLPRQNDLKAARPPLRGKGQGEGISSCFSGLFPFANEIIV
jgi:hypothetical protein